VRGIVTDGIPHYYGIPYAAPPVGPLRWRAPEPAATWTTPRDGSVKGAACPQAPGLLAGGSATNEDCLSLNGWRPNDAHGLPIIVHIHGGGHRAGSGRLIYDDHPALGDIIGNLHVIFDRL
jgi:para-nitrobenzyl esterase